MNTTSHTKNSRQTLVDRVYIRLLTVNKTTIDAQWQLQDVRNSHWRLYINFRAGAQVLVGEQWMDLMPNRIYFIPAWLTFSTQCVGTVEHFFMHFDILGLPGTLIRDVFDRVFCLAMDEGMLQHGFDLARRVDAKAHRNLEGQLWAKGFLYQAMGQLIGLLPENAQIELTGYDRAVAPVLPALRFLDQNFRRAVRNDDLAKLCHLSVDHFIRRFRSCVGQTPNQYVLERRIQSAAQQLAISRDSIERIADDNGFGNRHYFSRMFSRLMGMPPAAYRNMSRM